MRKVYKKLTEEQKKRGVIFSSCLSVGRSETTEDTKHDVLGDTAVYINTIARLKDDKFFNSSPWNFNIIRE